MLNDKRYNISVRKDIRGTQQIGYTLQPVVQEGYSDRFLDVAGNLKSITFGI